MTATTVKKSIAAFCFLLGTVLFLVGGYYIWSAPIEHGQDGLISIFAALLLHVIFWAFWP
jgi:hypothetical protein